MISLFEYIIEKLHINKDISTSRLINEDDYIFMVVWSNNGRDCIDTFNTRKDAQNFIDKLQNPQVFLCGFCVPDNQKLLWKLMELVQKKASFSTIEEFCKENKIKGIYA